MSSTEAGNRSSFGFNPTPLSAMGTPFMIELLGEKLLCAVDLIVKNLADGSGHVLDTASPFFGRKQPESSVALWIEVDDQNPFVVVRS
jgi:hypothetical protein